MASGFKDGLIGSIDTAKISKPGQALCIRPTLPDRALQVMETRKRILGLEYLDTLSSFNNLAHTCNFQQRTHDAIGLIKKSFELQHSVLGPSHPHTPFSSRSLKEWSETVKILTAKQPQNPIQAELFNTLEKTKKDPRYGNH